MNITHLNVKMSTIGNIICSSYFSDLYTNEQRRNTYLQMLERLYSSILQFSIRDITDVDVFVGHKDNKYNNNSAVVAYFGNILSIIDENGHELMHRRNPIFYYTAGDSCELFRLSNELIVQRISEYCKEYMISVSENTKFSDIYANAVEEYGRLIKRIAIEHKTQFAEILSAFMIYPPNRFISDVTTYKMFSDRLNVELYTDECKAFNISPLLLKQISQYVFHKNRINLSNVRNIIAACNENECRYNINELYYLNNLIHRPKYNFVKFLTDTDMDNIFRMAGIN